jgi:hypothetical protein
VLSFHCYEAFVASASLLRASWKRLLSLLRASWKRLLSLLRCVACRGPSCRLWGSSHKSYTPMPYKKFIETSYSPLLYLKTSSVLGVMQWRHDARAMTHPDKLLARHFSFGSTNTTGDILIHVHTSFFIVHSSSLNLNDHKDILLVLMFLGTLSL